jgi:hypothetical protein
LGLSELESLWEALLKARAAVYYTASTEHIQEQLLDWPWQRVNVSELKSVLKEDQDGDNHDNQGAPSEIAIRPRHPQSQERLQALHRQ